MAKLSATQASIAASCGPIQAAYKNEEGKRTGVKADADEFSDELKAVKEWIAKDQDTGNVNEELVERCENDIKELDATVKILFNSGLEFEGIKLTNIYIKYHAVLYFIICTAFLCMMVRARRNILKLVDEAMHIQIDRLGKTGSGIDYVSLSRPWWLSYLPDWRYGDSDTQLERIFSPSYFVRGAVIAMLMFGAFVIGSLYEALRFQRELMNIPLDERVPFFLHLKETLAPLRLYQDGRYDMLALTVLLVIIAVVIDNERGSRRPTRPQPVVVSGSRRRFLGLSVRWIGLAALTSLAVWFADTKAANVGKIKKIQAWAGIGTGRNPRFLPNRSLAKFSDPIGFYFFAGTISPSASSFNPSRVLHFVRPDGTMKGIFEEGKKPIHPVKDIDLSVTQPSRTISLNKSAYSQGIEATAISAVLRGDAGQAIKILRVGVAYDLNEGITFDRISRFNTVPHNLRIYDLLAGLLIRTERLAELDNFVEELRQRVPARKYEVRLKESANNWLEKRFQKWSDPGGNWAQRWHASKKVRWNGIDI
ncbi:hypothetical protein ACU8NU_26275 (plasmid) [Rhizobium leguminosarum]